MTIEQLKGIQKAALEFGIETLRETGALHTQFHLFVRNGPDEIHIVASPALMNTNSGKDALAKTVQERVDKGDIEAVVTLSDTYITVDEPPESMLFRRAFGIDLGMAREMNLCQVDEAVAALLESPIISGSLRQVYRRRDGNDGKDIELVGEPEELSDIISSRSRFGFFNRETKGATQ